MQTSTEKIKDKKLSNFDYNILSSQQRSIIQQCTGEIKERLRRTAEDVWEIGQKLVEVRSRLEYGQFDNWLSLEFGWSRRTAYNFINVYEAFSKNANFAQLNIATSALYKLASPSTSESVRQEFLAKAKRGEKITHKSITQTLKTEKNPVVPEKLQPISTPPQEIIEVIQQDKLGLEVSKVQTKQNKTKQNKTKHPKSANLFTTKILSDIQSGCWYLFEEINLLFCGDTALAEFRERTPGATLAIAITSDDWDHDWLVEAVNNLIVLHESYIREGLIEQIVSLFSRERDTIIMPWLPDVEMLAIAYRMKRRIVAGDPSPLKCQKAIAQLAVAVEQSNF